MNIFNSEAPTLSTFLALAGEPTVMGPGPSLPAATSRPGGWGGWGAVVRVECKVFIRLWAGLLCTKGSQSMSSSGKERKKKKKKRGGKKTKRDTPRIRKSSLACMYSSASRASMV